MNEKKEDKKTLIKLIEDAEWRVAYRKRELKEAELQLQSLKEMEKK